MVGIDFVFVGIVVVVAAFPVNVLVVACAVIDDADDDFGLDKAMAIAKSSFGCTNKPKTITISL